MRCRLCALLLIRKIRQERGECAGSDSAHLPAGGRCVAIRNTCTAGDDRRAAFCNHSSNHRGSSSFRNHHRLASNEGLIRISHPFQHLSISSTRDPGRTRATSPTRSNARRTLSISNCVTRSAVSGSRAARASRAPWGLSKRFHFEPVAEKHDADQGRKLPPDVNFENTES